MISFHELINLRHFLTTIFILDTLSTRERTRYDLFHSDWVIYLRDM